ncbi:type IA DNA topoisomerase [Fructobacillus sp. M158]|uniref:DNA topoisomerase n=1 Tax=Fructobacillus parabroussonetiae TaxID=2713174 RepID=UPI00200B9C4C|nr:DNA topoisomerase [Fructobacillus parabroussonetiae]MCK8617037.1 type IA DNA topoisomerase [Fructobacillus parabroussonetiae]
MPHYLIMTEKPSARKNFAKALGGQKGHLVDYDFELTNLRGHLMTLKEPDQQVPADLKAKYESWKLKDLPWNLDDLSWQRTYIKSYNPRSKRSESTKKIVDEVKAQAVHADGIIIATDTDPSGEGDLLAWEAIDAIGWTGPVFRATFTDESAKSLIKALTNLKPITSKATHSAYQKGLARNKWDFASMQLTRAATTLTKKEGYPIVSRQGRLKSAMLLKIYQQLEAIKHYVKVPYFEYRFQDEEGNHYARKVDSKIENVPFRYSSTEDLLKSEQFKEHSAVQEDARQEKVTRPPKLLDLSSLSAILAKEGFKAKEVLATYQKLYEAQIVSYPRTEDKTITKEQFQDMLPLVDSIAAVVHLDSRQLTHRTARATHVQDKGAHGANRPGTKVPASLEALQQYGPSAKRIYEVLSKNFLAMFAEDYRYLQIIGSLVDYPDFKTTVHKPIAMGWKQVYNDQNAEQEGTEESKVLGKEAQRFVYEGQNPKPTSPTWKWLKTFLEKNNIGTGATRTSTYGELSSGPKAYIQDKKGKISLTTDGLAAAIMAQNTWLAHPKTTKRVFDIFDQVGRFEMTADQALDSIVKTVDHDIPVMVENAKQLKAALGEPKKKARRKTVAKSKVSGIWQGQEVTFTSEFSGHQFTAEEIQDLLAGKRITFSAKSKRGKMLHVSGKLANQVYRKRQYVGFKAEFE